MGAEPLSADSLTENFDHYGKLASQFPIARLRIVYAKAGTLPAACIVRNSRAVIDHKLYWMAPPSENEANYLAAILNSETARARVAQYQSRGQWGARDFDKVTFNLPIPRFDPDEPLHRDLAEAGTRAEATAATVALPENVRFQRARALVRTALSEAGIAQIIDNLVAKLLDGGTRMAVTKSRSIPELSIVALKHPVESNRGVLPEGGRGTVVHVYRDGKHYEVEFSEPFPCTVTVGADDIEPA